MKLDLTGVTLEDLQLTTTTTTTGTKMNPKIGSMFEDWLKGTGIYDEVTKEAKRRVDGWQRTECAVERFARDNPKVTTICISCSCPKCQVTCY